MVILDGKIIVEELSKKFFLNECTMIPFIRYQYYDEGQQELAGEIFKKAGLKRSKLTNAWVTFVVGCSLLLKETGKMGFVIPSELLQVTYAQQLRKYLATSLIR